MVNEQVIGNHLGLKLAYFTVFAKLRPEANLFSTWSRRSTEQEEPRIDRPRSPIPCRQFRYGKWKERKTANRSKAR